MRPDLPRGTVTFLFTDVEGSTRLLHELGTEAYAEALGEHRRMIREACAAEGGVEVDTQGDAFFFAFPTAPGALAAAQAFTDALAPGPVQVRVGLHTGSPLLADEGYVGDDVHRAARIAAAASGGQVVLSGAMRMLLDERWALLDLGEHRFKDLRAPERVFQLGEAPFPPLRSFFRTNLPVPANPLIGRKKELADVLRIFVEDVSRAVTVTGAGGVGKTRFAIAAAAEASDGFPDGVWFVDLTPLRDPALVLPTVAHTVGVDGELTRAFAESSCLLLLDNCEQVVGAAGDIAALLGACPGVRVLATSREPLRIAVEREYPLRPLPESPAVELFRHRTGAVAPDVEIEYALAAGICERLDRLPLAIELAAARMKVFEPAALLERLDDRLPLLVSRARDLPERQQALRATIAWSYELLDPDEQQLFRRLAVFRGGSTLESIEVVTGAGSELAESLVDKSLLRLRRGRLVMLETIREFARELLEGSGEGGDVRLRHAEHFAEVAEQANLNAGDLRSGGQRLDVALAEQDNIRAALSWTIAVGDAGLGLRIATAIEQFWVVNDPEEGTRWFAALFDLPHADAVDPGLRAQALRAWGSAVDIAGDGERAQRLYQRSLALHDALGDDHGRAVLLHRLSIRAMRTGDLARARALVDESHVIHERNGNTWGLAQIVGTLGALERDAGELDRASQLVAESAELAREVGVPWWYAGMFAELAALALEEGRVDDADAQAREALRLVQEMRDYGGRVLCVGILAGVAAERGNVERAGRLWGAIEDEQVGAPLGGWLRHRTSVGARIEGLAGDELDSAIGRGRALSLDHAVEEALAED